MTMNLYKQNYLQIIDADKVVWEQLKQNEIVYHDGKPTSLRKTLYHSYPKSIRHYLSLFPNNFIDAIDLIREQEKYETLISEFEELINNISTMERDVLNFIRDKEAYFIIGSILKNNYLFGHHALYLFPEFKLAPNYQVDYLLIGKNSAGYHFVFVELENIYTGITTNDGNYGGTIRRGVKQIDDWEIWLEQNFSHLKLVFNQFINNSDTLPNEFRDLDKTRIHYIVIAGRRIDYNNRTYRLRRSNIDQRKLLILHYDNLIDFSKEVLGSATY